MTRILIILTIMLFGLTDSTGQGLDEDNMVLYMKANVLYESERYDEAVRMYNRILNADENHTNALFMRSKAKFELGAYRGTKSDILSFIERAGVTKGVVKLMAHTEFNLSNLKASQNYVETAIELDPYDDVMHLLSGDISMESGERNEACESYAAASHLGNQKAVQRMNKRCNGYRLRQNSDDSAPESNSDIPVVITKDSPEVEEERKEGDIVSLEEIVREAENASESSSLPPVIEEPKRPENSVDMNARQEIMIDDMLNIVLDSGLGDRKLDSKPSIFMLSNQDGLVVIDICVNQQGMVTEAVFNRDKSTIFRSSLTSLALRKAKQFTFVRSSMIEQCGSMVYDIKS